MTNEQMFEIIWPEKKWVGAGIIKLWYDDAVANGDAENIGLNDVNEMAIELSSIGIITLGRGRR